MSAEELSVATDEAVSEEKEEEEPQLQENENKTNSNEKIVNENTTDPPGNDVNDKKVTVNEDHDTSEELPKEGVAETVSGTSDNDGSKKNNDEGHSERKNGDSENYGDFDKSSVVYEGDKCVYVDPNTKFRYIWDSNKNEWVAEQSQQCDVSSKASDYHFDGTTYMYTDKESNIEYKWDTEKSEWCAVEQKKTVISDSSSGGKETNADSIDAKKSCGDDSSKEKVPALSTTVGGGGVYGYENDTHTYTDPTDNTVYIWDRDKNAWFPKVDDDFLAHYQMNYGFTDPNKDSSGSQKVDETKSSEGDKTEEEMKDVKGEKRKAQQQEPTWFEVDEQSNTKVYVSNLPLDITEKEFVDVMQKCGLVMKDLDTGKMKVKLYTEPGTSQLKGDGLCTYIKKESVELALNLLDGYDYKGHKLHVERARFTMKGDAYDPSLKPKKRKKKDKEKMKKMQEKLFDWRPDKLRGERSRNESVVIVKNLFEPSIFEKDVKLILEYQQDLREECVKLGAVKRVIIYDRHPEGVAQINFKEPEAADACVQLLNGRWFNKRRITAETWDGKTKYKIVETEEELKKRMEKWEAFLHAEEERANEERKMEKERDRIAKESLGRDASEGIEKKENFEKEDSEMVEERDSDQETKSSVGSDYMTDEELDRDEDTLKNK